MVAALFVRKDSVYHAMPGVDAWDVQRNARYFPGGMPVVAHPPCSQWGTLSHMARHDQSEKELGIIAVNAVRLNGGVLEHPKRSKLWKYMGLPAPGEDADGWGGWTLLVNQWWWGHLAEKATLLYIVGVTPDGIPPLPEVPPGKPRFICGQSGRRRDQTRTKERPEIQKRDREHTPPAFAAWLVELARRCGR
jgi:hypothetical protein